MITEKGRFAQFRRNWATRARATRKDRANRLEFGSSAPKYAERLWVRTQDLEYGLKHWSSKKSALVVTAWPEDLSRPLYDWVTIRACLDHWVKGVSWEETGMINQMMAWIDEKGKVDRLSSRAEVLKRYEQLDALYEVVRKERRLRTRGELVAGNFREEGGVLVHIGPDGRPFFGGKGNHRLAIAIAAGLEYFPAQLGVVHLSALHSLPQYRHCSASHLLQS